MARQAEVRARSRPGFLSAGIRVDQAHNAVLMFAVIMALQTVLIFDRACDVLGSHAELTVRSQDSPATEDARPRMARSTRLDLEVKIRLADLSNVAVCTILDLHVHIIRSAVAVNTTVLFGRRHTNCVRTGADFSYPGSLRWSRFELRKRLFAHLGIVDCMKLAGSE